MSFSSIFMERDTKTATFYKQLNQLIDWRKIQTLINRHYTKGQTLKGEKPYCGLLLFKMLLLGVWNNLSDEKTEDYLKENLCAMNFCGLALEDAVPDHSTLSRFRTILTQTGAMDKLLKAVNRSLEKHKLVVNKEI